MSDDLKPCPFCASPALALHAMHSVICSSRSETTCAAIYYDPREWQQRPAEDALRARAEAAEAEAERLRSAIAETLRLADIYAGVAAHNAEAEPETAGEAWRSPYMATMRELRRALGGAA